MSPRRHWMQSAPVEKILTVTLLLIAVAMVASCVAAISSSGPTDFLQLAVLAIFGQLATVGLYESRLRRERATRATVSATVAKD